MVSDDFSCFWSGTILYLAMEKLFIYKYAYIQLNTMF